MNDDSELVKLLQKGNEAAFTELINKYNRKLFSYAVSLSGDYSLAKDIVQDVFIKTFEYRKKLDPQFSIQGFLYRSVYNQFINQYHKNKSLLKVHDEYVKFLDQIVNDTSESNFEKMIEILNKSIIKLPEKCRKVFILSKKDGLTNIEISEYLNISIKTVESHITYAFKQIKDNIPANI
jgi:RNA polymerase sigma-70 factor (ECF subfamily)|tara:strand:- start:866 stop:1402 length:537 start_codon:yes stop_codon:yes gene_type:complete